MLYLCRKFKATDMCYFSKICGLKSPLFNFLYQNVSTEKHFSINSCSSYKCMFLDLYYSLSI